MPRDGGADFPLVAGDLPAENGQIDFLHGPPGELSGKGDVCGVVFRHHHAPAGIFVEAVNNAGPGHAAHAAELSAAMMHQRVDQRPPLVPRGGMHHQTRRFVQHQQGLVLIEDIQRDFLRLNRRRPRLRPVNLDLVPRPRRVRRFDEPAIDADMSLLNQTLNGAARYRGKAAAQKTVQPLRRQRLFNG